MHDCWRKELLLASSPPFYLLLGPHRDLLFAGGLFLEVELTALDIISSFRQEALRKDMIGFLSSWMLESSRTIKTNKREKISFWTYLIFSFSSSFLCSLFPPSIFLSSSLSLPLSLPFPSFLDYSLNSFSMQGSVLGVEDIEWPLPSLNSKTSTSYKEGFGHLWKIVCAIYTNNWKNWVSGVFKNSFSCCLWRGYPQVRKSFPSLKPPYTNADISGEVSGNFMPKQNW